MKPPWSMKKDVASAVPVDIANASEEGILRDLVLHGLHIEEQ